MVPGMRSLSHTLLCGDLSRKFESSIKKESERIKTLFIIYACIQQVVVECLHETGVQGVKDTQEKNTYNFCSWRGSSLAWKKQNWGSNPHAKRGSVRSLRRKSWRDVVVGA